MSERTHVPRCVCDPCIDTVFIFEYPGAEEMVFTKTNIALWLMVKLSVKSGLFILQQKPGQDS